MRTIFFHEMKQGLRTLIIWSVAVAALIMLCMIIFPEMAKESAGIDEMFASMGGFTAAFGMDQLSIADPLGYYGVEGGTILGLGGGLFAAFLGARMLSKEETEHAAEFLLTHPVSRSSVVSGKLLALLVQILIFNLVCLAFGVASFALIDEAIEGNGFWLLHLAQFVMHFEIACICFGASALLKRGSVGFGLGLAGLLYFLNIFANLSKEWEFVRYITPFGYADAANILPDVAINGEVFAFGVMLLMLGVVAAYLIYTKKDIAV